MIGTTLQAAYGVLNRKARRARAARLRRRRATHFEPLEPRLLLSANPLGAAAPISMPPLDMPGETSALWEEPLRAVDLSLQPLAAQGGHAGASAFQSVDAGRAASAGVVIEADPGLELSALDSDDLSALLGQVIYLDIDGASGVRYDGPVRVEGIDVPEFQAPAALAGEESRIIASALAGLNERFAGLGVTFTEVRPEGGTDYSTVYVGGDGSAFSQYGSFLGLA